MTMPLSSYKAPIVQLRVKQQATVPLNGAVAAGAYRTWVAGPFPFRCRVTRLEMSFNEEAYNLVEHRWYFSGNDTAPTLAWPGDTNIFDPYAPVEGFYGRAKITVVTPNAEAPFGTEYLKLCVRNGSNYQFVADCLATIEEV